MVGCRLGFDGPMFVTGCRMLSSADRRFLVVGVGGGIRFLVVEFRLSVVGCRHRLDMELDLQSSFGLHVT